MLVTDWNPLTIWLFKKPYIRFPAHDYTTDNLSNNFIHLANNSIAKNAEEENKNAHKIDGNMMYIEDF